jgi:hypothetical protein
VSFTTADVTAVAGRDYAATSGTVTFPPGAISESITVAVLPDASTGTSEEFYVNLGMPTGAALARGQAVGAIHADGSDVLGGIYTEDFVHRFTHIADGFLDQSGVFLNHTNGQGYFLTDPAGINTQGNPALVLRSGATDRITFPDLDPAVSVAFATLQATALTGTVTVDILGANGRYEALIKAGAGTQTVAVGSEYVLQGDALNPLLELGAIREIDLFPTGNAVFDQVKVLVGQEQPPVAVDQFATTAPGQPVSIAVLAGDSEAGGVPLHLVDFTQPAYPGSTTTPSASDPNVVVYQPGAGSPYRDSFAYTVADALGQTATALVQVTVDTPPTADDNTITRSVQDGAMVGDVIRGQVSFSPATATVTLIRGPQHNDNARVPFQFDAQGHFIYCLGAIDDSFTFQVSDGTELSRVATETITVVDPALPQLQLAALPLLAVDQPVYGDLYSYDGVSFGHPPGTGSDPIFFDNLYFAILRRWNTQEQLPRANPATGDFGDGVHNFLTNTQLAVVDPPIRGTGFAYHGDGTFYYDRLTGFTGYDVMTMKATDGFEDSLTFSVRIVSASKDATNNSNFNHAVATNASLAETVEMDAPVGWNVTGVGTDVDPPVDYPPGVDGSQAPFGFLHFTLDGRAYLPTPPRPAPVFKDNPDGHLDFGLYYVVVTYTGPQGESPASLAGLPDYDGGGADELFIPSPPDAAGVTGWNAYVAGPGSHWYSLQPGPLVGGANAIGQNLDVFVLQPPPVKLLPDPQPATVPQPPSPPTAVPVVSATGNGGTIPSGNYFVKLTYVAGMNESTAGPARGIAIGPGQQLTINAPPVAAPPVVNTGWRVYVAAGPYAPFVLQGGTNSFWGPLTLSSLALSGPAPPPVKGLATYLDLQLPVSLPNPVAYFKYGPTPDEPADHWYNFLFDNASRTGAVLAGQYDALLGEVVPEHHVILHFVDGQRGDDGVYKIDQFGNVVPGGQDGIIEDAGTPVFSLPTLSAAISGPPQTVRGQPTTFNLTAQEAPPADPSAGYTYTVDWGDGSPVQMVAATAGNGYGVAVAHAFANGGTYEVQIAASDGQGNSSVLTTTTVMVGAAALEPDPLATGQTVLAVGGTPHNDTIILHPTDRAGDIQVVINGQIQGVYRPTGHIIVYASAGNDTVRLGGPIRLPAFLFAGNGRDVLSAAGSTADNVLVAGTGTSSVIGGAGRDILIASPQSVFQPGRGDDLLIKGITPFNSDLASLNALLAEWARPGIDDRTRINDLVHGGGLNGNVVLSGAVPAPRAPHNTLLASPIVVLQPALLTPMALLPASTMAPAFRWGPVANADHYRLTVDDLTAGKLGVLAVDVTGTAYTPQAPLTPGHRYRWSVRAYDALGNGSLPSKAVGFTMAALGAPTPVSPGGLLPSSMTVPTFYWSPVVGADHYEVLVDDIGANRPGVLHETQLAGAAWTPSTPLLPGHRYRWRIHAIGATGIAGPWSRYGAFAIALPGKPS